MLDMISIRRPPEGFTLAQLRTFACVARTGSFVRAAEALEISQPAVSNQIKSLEISLGRQLFRRRRGTTPQLNENGEEVLKAVLDILSECDDLLTRGRRATQKVLIRISVGPYLRDAYLRPLTPRICRECPDVEIELHPMKSEARSMQLIENGFIDLAVFAVTEPTLERSAARSVGELPMVAVAPPGTKQRLSSGEVLLEDMQFIFPLRRDIGAPWARSQLRRLHLVPRTPLLFVEFADLVADMVEEGQGIAFLLAHTVSDRIASGHLEVLDLGLQPLRRVIARSPKAPEIAKKVEKLLIETLPSHQHSGANTGKLQPVP